jgi:hypothetical protein
LTGFGPYTLAIDAQHPATLYAASSGGSSSGSVLDGVFKSTNGGESWMAMNTGLTNSAGVGLAINPSGTCLHAATAASVFDFATQPDSDCPSTSLVSAILPSSRSVTVDGVATAFATIQNAGSGLGDLATGNTCGITQLTGLPTPFTFQSTDPVTNLPVRLPNVPVNILPGRSQSFLISLRPIDAFCATDVTFGFGCGNTANAIRIKGVNTLLLSASLTTVPDIVALAATPTNDGIVNVPSLLGSGAFAVATINVGVGGVITASADTGDAQLPVALFICETDPANGSCKASPAPSVTRRVEANETPTFSVFVVGQGSVPFDPANNRVFMRLKENALCEGQSAVVTRGSTSVAVRTQ